MPCSTTFASLTKSFLCRREKLCILKALLAECKAEEKANRSSVPGKTRRQVKAESSLEEAKQALQEAQDAKTTADAAERKLEAALMTDHEDEAAVKLHLLRGA